MRLKGAMLKGVVWEIDVTIIQVFRNIVPGPLFVNVIYRDRVPWFCIQGRGTIHCVRALGSSVHGQVLSTTGRRFIREKCLGASVHRVTSTMSMNMKGLCGCFRGGSRLFYIVLHPMSSTLRQVLRRRRKTGKTSVVLVYSRRCLGSTISRCVSLVGGRNRLVGVLLFRSRNSSLRTFERSCAGHSARVIGA